MNREDLYEMLNTKPELPFDQIENKETWQKRFSDDYHPIVAYMLRDTHISQRGFPIITEEVLMALVRLLWRSKTADIGCGTGYLSYHLLSKGIDVTPIDNRSSHYLDENSPINDKVVKAHYNDIDVSLYDTFIISWPNYQGADIETFVNRLPRGKRVIYQGEWDGCTGTEDFHEILDTAFTKDCSASYKLNSEHITFDGIHDKWYVYIKD